MSLTCPKCGTDQVEWTRILEAPERQDDDPPWFKERIVTFAAACEKGHKFKIKMTTTSEVVK